MAKVAFSRSDVMNIDSRMSGKLAALKEAGHSSPFTVLSRSPSSPIAAKLMREIGVSDERMSEAYRAGMTAAIKAK